MKKGYTKFLSLFLTFLLTIFSCGGSGGGSGNGDSSESSLITKSSSIIDSFFVSPLEGQAPLEVEVSFRINNEYEDLIKSCRIDWGDGSYTDCKVFIYEANNYNHTYQKSGIYNLTLKVKTDEGSDAKSISISVLNEGEKSLNEIIDNETKSLYFSLENRFLPTREDIDLINSVKEYASNVKLSFISKPTVINYQAHPDIFSYIFIYQPKQPEDCKNDIYLKIYKIEKEKNFYILNDTPYEIRNHSQSIYYEDINGEPYCLVQVNVPWNEISDVLSTPYQDYNIYVTFLKMNKSLSIDPTLGFSYFYTVNTDKIENFLSFSSIVPKAYPTLSFLHYLLNSKVEEINTEKFRFTSAFFKISTAPLHVVSALTFPLPVDNPINSILGISFEILNYASSNPQIFSNSKSFKAAIIKQLSSEAIEELKNSLKDRFIENSNINNAVPLLGLYLIDISVESNDSFNNKINEDKIVSFLINGVEISSKILKAPAVAGLKALQYVWNTYTESVNLAGDLLNGIAAIAFKSYTADALYKFDKELASTFKDIFQNYLLKEDFCSDYINKSLGYLEQENYIRSNFYDNIDLTGWYSKTKLFALLLSNGYTSTTSCLIPSVTDSSLSGTAECNLCGGFIDLYSVNHLDYPIGHIVLSDIQKAVPTIAANTIGSILIFAELFTESYFIVPFQINNYPCPNIKKLIGEDIFNLLLKTRISEFENYLRLACFPPEIDINATIEPSSIVIVDNTTYKVILSVETSNQGVGDLICEYELNNKEKRSISCNGRTEILLDKESLEPGINYITIYARGKDINGNTIESSAEIPLTVTIESEIPSSGSSNETNTSQESTPEKGNIQGAVKDAVTKEALEGVKVSLLNASNDTVAETVTDTNGNFNLVNVPVGNYTIMFTKEGYIPASGNVVVEANSTVTYPTLMQIDTEHSGNGTVQGIVKDAINGQPVPGVTIKVFEGINNISGEPVTTISTLEDGSYQLELKAGYYTFLLTKDSYKETSYSLSVVGNTVNTKEFTISPILPANEVRIVLTWGENPPDLDSHLVKVKDGSIQYHLYYPYAQSNEGDPWEEVDLDVDDTSSFGPETITIYNLDTSATYKYYVHDYSTYSGDTSTALANSGATVKVYWGDRTYTYYVPNLPGTAWKVFEIVNGTLVPCTGDDCVFGVSSETDSQFGTRATTSVNPDVELFKNLPTK